MRETAPPAPVEGGGRGICITSEHFESETSPLLSL